MADPRPVPTATLAGHLRRSPLFTELPDRELRALAKQVTLRAFEGDTFVVRRGEEGVGLYLVLTGTVEVRKGTREVMRLHEGQFFGEMSLLDGEVHSADVRTTGPAVLGIISRWDFEAFAYAHPRVYKGMVRELVRRLRVTDQSLSS